MGAQLALLANINRDSKARREPFTPYDFGLPFLRETEEVQSPKSQEQQEFDEFQQVQAMTLAMGGKVVKRDG